MVKSLGWGIGAQVKRQTLARRGIVLPDSLKVQVEGIDSAIEPLTHHTTFAIPDPSNFVHPLDRLGIREDAMHALGQLAAIYESGDAVTRQAIRSLFKANRYFNWAVHPTRPLKTPEEVRLMLIRFSMADQVPDPRDASMDLYYLKKDAEAAGLEYTSVAHEVAAMSSDAEPLDGYRSTREVLMALR